MDGVRKIELVPEYMECADMETHPQPKPRNRIRRPYMMAVVLGTARALERVPELLGVGPHLLATGLWPLRGYTG